MSSAQVNRPTNVKEKQADIDRKLQIYGILTGKTMNSSFPYLN